MAYLKIGELAKKTGLVVGTLRYYSDRGVLQPMERGSNGYRYYSEAASHQVEFIKKAQALGFSLEEIKQIIDVSLPKGEYSRERRENSCGLVQSLLSDKIEQLEIQIRRMALLKAELEEYRSAWATKPKPNPKSNSQEICPLISSVSI